MKLSRIKRCLLEAKKAILYEANSGREQWIGTEDACWRVDLVGTELDIESLGGLFDLSETQKTALHTSVMQRGWSGLEPAADEPMPTVMHMPVTMDKTYLPVTCGGKLYLIDLNKIRAADIGKAHLDLMMDKNSAGDPLVLVYGGRRVQAILRPESDELAELVMKEARLLAGLEIGVTYKDGKRQMRMSEMQEDEDNDHEGDEDLDTGGV